MAKSPGIRKTLELLLKKVGDLENQVFAQRLHIDELEGKLLLAEEAIKQVKENPFGNVPIMSPYIAPAPMPHIQPLPYQPLSLHICSAGPMDSAGNSWCTQCGAQMSPTWTITSNQTFCQADPQSQSSSGVEEIDLDINWDDTFIK